MSRRRYVYRPDPETGEVRAVEVAPDFQAHAERMPLFTDRFMEGDRAPDGTDIGSRQRRKAWMEHTGSADASDFTKHWEHAKRKRENLSRHGDRKGLAELIGRTAYQLKQGRRK